MNYEYQINGKIHYNHVNKYTLQWRREGGLFEAIA